MAHRGARRVFTLANHFVPDSNDSVVAQPTRLETNVQTYPNENKIVITGQWFDDDNNTTTKTEEETSESATTTTEKKGYTMEEVSKHTTEDDCWVVVNGKVLNVTDFLPDHPGGAKAIMLYAGRDASVEFNMLHKADVVDKYAPDSVIGDLIEGGDSAGQGGKKGYTAEEVSKHNTKDDCWVSVNGKVLNVTEFLPDHPGGEKAIMLYAGRDASVEFNMLHKADVIEKYAPDSIIGDLIEGGDSAGHGESSGGKKGYTAEEVSKHNTKDDCWVIVNGKVLDVTDFLPDHPGGEKAIMLYAGRDATVEFNMLHKADVVEKYAPDSIIGDLVD